MVFFLDKCLGRNVVAGDEGKAPNADLENMPCSSSFGNGNCGAGTCIGSVTIDGNCYWAAEVNWVLWGHMRQVCQRFYVTQATGTRLSWWGNKDLGGKSARYWYKLKGRPDRRIETIDDVTFYAVAWRLLKYPHRLLEDPESEPARRSPGVGDLERVGWTMAGWYGDFSVAKSPNVNTRCPPCAPDNVYTGFLTAFIGAENYDDLAPLNPLERLEVQVDCSGLDAPFQDQYKGVRERVPERKPERRRQR